MSLKPGDSIAYAKFLPVLLNNTILGTAQFGFTNPGHLISEKTHTHYVSIEHEHGCDGERASHEGLSY